MHSNVRKNFIKLYFCLSLVVIILSTFNLARDINRPFGGVLTFYNVIANGFYVDIQSPSWWLPHDDVQNLRGHRLLTIDGVNYSYDYERLGYDLALDRGSTHIHLTIEDGQVSIPFVIALMKFSWQHFLDFKTPLFLIAIGTWMMGLAIYQANPHSITNQILTILLCAIALNNGVSHPRLFTHEGSLAKILDLTNIVSSSFTGALIVHFAVLFPQPLSILSKKNALKSFNFLIYGVSFVIAICYASSRLLLWNVGPTTLVRNLDKFAYYAMQTYHGAAMISLLGHSIWVLLDAQTSKRVRNEIVVLLIGISLYLPYLVIVGFGVLGFGGATNFWQYLDLRYFALALLATFVIIDLRYQTFYKTPPLAFYILVIAFAALIGNISTAILYSFYPYLANTNSLPPFFIVFTTLVFVSLVWSTQTSWRGWFRRLLYWEQDNYASVHNFGQHLFSYLEFARMPVFITQALCKDLELECAAIWLWDGKTSTFDLASYEGQWTQPLPEQLCIPLTFTNQLRLLEPTPIIPDWAQPLSQLGMLEMLVPLQTSNQLLGVLGLGKRWDERVFDERSLEILNLIGQQASLFILTSLQIQRLRQIPYLVTAAQEKERQRIAQELHDTIQQFLGRLPFYLEVSRDLIPSKPQESEAILQRCITDVESAAQTLRQIRNNLSPTHLNDSFVNSVTALVERFRFTTQLDVDLKLDSELDAKMPLQVRHALYRVIQQALDNIMEHAQASFVKIHVFLQNDYIVFIIMDNGTGSSEQQRIYAQQQDSFGLQSMEARIESINGEFTFNSNVGAGTKISGKIPINV